MKENNYGKNRKWMDGWMSCMLPLEGSISASVSMIGFLVYIFIIL